MRQKHRVECSGNRIKTTGFYVVDALKLDSDKAPLKYHFLNNHGPMIYNMDKMISLITV